MSDQHVPALRRRFLEDMRIKGHPTRCGTALPPICSRAGPTSG